MGSELTASVKWTEGLHFEGLTPTGYGAPLDHFPPEGAGRGSTPLELVLISLAACGGQTVISLMAKMRQDVRAFSVSAAGKKREGHPKVFTEIHLNFRLEGIGLNRELVEKAVRLAEEKYCPVWTMLKSTVRIDSEIELLEAANGR